MQFYDIVMLTVLAGTVLFGFWKGMAWQLAALASIVLSAVVAINFSPQLAPVFSDQTPWNRIIAMLVLYLATALAIWLLFRVVAGWIDRVKLKEFDHQIGALFGLAKGVLWCVIITFFAVTLREDLRQKILPTYSGRYIAVLIRNAAPVLPKEVTDVLGEYIKKLDEKLDPNTPAQTPPVMETTGLADFGRSVVNDLKQNANQGESQLREGLQGKLDELGRQLKDSVDRARDETKERMNNLPQMGDSSADKAQSPSQGRGGSRWFR